ncbi:hypothetical protein GA0115233_102542 [Streptomyces sp. DI166]|nr:hypothetical protein GA0115233_102542 [Streptomyces sp. DI166]
MSADTDVVDAELDYNDPPNLPGVPVDTKQLTPEANEVMAKSRCARTRRTYTERWRTFAYGRQERSQKHWISARGHVNVQRPAKIQARRCHCSAAITSPKPLGWASRGWPAGMAPPWEARLSESAIRCARFTSPVLFALGGLNAWIGRKAGDYPAVSTGLCLSVCAAGLFGEDLLQRGYRDDRVVLAHVARHPGATTRQACPRGSRAPRHGESRPARGRRSANGRLGRRARSRAFVRTSLCRRGSQVGVGRVTRRAT